MKTTKIAMMGLVAALATGSWALTSENIFGILRVDSYAKETIISVPWISTDLAGGDIKESNLVLTSNLTDGDQLLYYTASRAGSQASTFSYLGWQLKKNADGTGTWEPMTTVSKNRIAVAPDSNEQTTPRGAGLIIIRPTNYTTPIYLYGQYDKTPNATTVATTGTKTAPVYTLLAPSGPDGVNLNASGVMTGTPNPQDSIILNNGHMLNYLEGRWCRMVFDPLTKKNKPDESEATLAPGIGVWYVSRGASTGVTFNWPQ